MQRILFGAALFVATSANAETLNVERYYPSAVPEMETINSIAVDRFEGSDGEALSFALEEYLGATALNGTPVFSLVDYRTGSKADALLSGTASVTVEQFPAEQTRNKCVERDGKNACIKYADIRIECVRRTVALTAAVRLSAFSDGRILMSRQIPERDSQMICADDSQSARTVEEIVGTLMRNAVRSLPSLAPRRETENVALLEDSKGLPKPLVKQFRTAVKLTKTDTAQACNAFEAISAAAPDHGPTRFNIGLCQEWRGERAEAEALYTVVAAGPQYRKQAEAGLSRLDIDRRGRAEWMARDSFRSGKGAPN